MHYPTLLPATTSRYVTTDHMTTRANKLRRTYGPTISHAGAHSDSHLLYSSLKQMPPATCWKDWVASGHFMVPNNSNLAF